MLNKEAIWKKLILSLGTASTYNAKEEDIFLLFWFIGYKINR